MIIDDITGQEGLGVDRPPLELFVDRVKTYAMILLDSRAKVVSWNDGAALLFGYPPAEVVGQPFSRFSCLEDVQAGRPEEELRQAELQGHVIGEGWQVRRDGTRFWSSAVTTALRDERGLLEGFVKVLRDVTERRQLEMEVRRQAAELAEANRRKDEFLAMLSHELRNPLAPVLNSVQVLRQVPHDSPLVQVAGSMVERQVHHMARLIDDLLEATRLTHGKVRLRRERVELGALVERAAESIQPRMTERSHHFERVRSRRPIWLEVDSVRLEQVVVNLLDNAAQFTEPGGRIELAVTREAAEAVIRVRDDGMGIAPDLLPRVFDLFAQAETSLDRSPGGLGIGLTLVQRIVTLHGGTITASSEGPGRGSEFVVRLPVPPEEAEHSRRPGLPAAAAAAAAAGLLRILIVDDNVDMATSLSILLQLRGHSVDTAHDGCKALEMSQATRYDAILLDIGLPRMDGYEVARRIRRQPGDPPPLLIAISGYGFDADQQMARNAGFDHYLVKPVDSQALESWLAELSAARQGRGSPPSPRGA